MNAADPCFQAWLVRETGIDPSSLGSGYLVRAVLERVSAMQAADSDTPHRPSLAGPSLPGATTQVTDAAVQAYWERLNASQDERRALIEMLVVPETWFFREREAFAALARLAHERLVREPACVLRVLSAPCSTGEEPYSAAMALLDSGIDATRFTIDAIDISTRAIDRAQRACYGRNSFRGHAVDFRDRHFSGTSGGWQLNERVRQVVRFKHANLLELPGDGDARYDFIFCRNVLIYFDREAQDRAIRALEAQLAEHGVIFVGPAETGVMMRHGMTSARIPLAFAFQRARTIDAARATVASDHQAAHSTPRIGSTAIAPASTLPAIAPPAVALPAPVRPSAATRPTSAQPSLARERLATPAVGMAPQLSLDAARSLADAGGFDAAERAVNEFMTVKGPNADAFHLLGLIADARGRVTEASDFYRKALYLEPIHQEALTHLAALLDIAGDRAGAQRLMQRAQRAAAHEPASSIPDTGNPRGFHGSRRH
jgi:chemotaxis protein methyltransferase WspC